MVYYYIVDLFVHNRFCLSEVAFGIVSISLAPPRRSSAAVIPDRLRIDQRKNPSGEEEKRAGWVTWTGGTRSRTTTPPADRDPTRTTVPSTFATLDPWTQSMNGLQRALDDPEFPSCLPPRWSCSYP